LACNPCSAPVVRDTRGRHSSFFQATRQEVTMKLSARNMLKGKIVEVKKGQTTAHVRIDIGGSIVTSSITNEAVDELKLAAGQTAYAVVKASDVMIAID
jgi:molybdopterin-binding protein